MRRQQVFDLLLVLRTSRDARLSPADATRGMADGNCRTAPFDRRPVPDAGSRPKAADLLDAAERIDTAGLPLALTGDFWHGNILFNGKEPLALIDWDRWAEHDLATHDLLHYLCYRRMLRTGCTWSRALCAWLDDVGADPSRPVRRADSRIYSICRRNGGLSRGSRIGCAR